MTSSFLLSVVLVPLFFTLTQCRPLDSPSVVCLKKVDRMKNMLDNLKLEQTRTGNVTIANMEIFYDVCTDTVNCIDSMELPGIVKGLMHLSTFFLQLACDDYGFRVGPFSKCIEKTRFDLTTLKNGLIERAEPKCELTEQELSELEQVVRKQCDAEAVDDLRKNERRVRLALCTEESIQ